MLKLNNNIYMRLSIVLFLLIALFGCAPGKIGKPPNTDALTLLIPKISTKTDVLRILGNPDGYGKTDHTPDELDQRDIWLYRYAVSTVSTRSQFNMKFLFVYLNGEKYDGFLWFSSVSAIEAN